MKQRVSVGNGTEGCSYAVMLRKVSVFVSVLIFVVPHFSDKKYKKCAC
jgi:hypothetical protein